MSNEIVFVIGPRDFEGSANTSVTFSQDLSPILSIDFLASYMHDCFTFILIQVPLFLVSSPLPIQQCHLCNRDYGCRLPRPHHRSCPPSLDGQWSKNQHGTGGYWTGEGS